METTSNVAMERTTIYLPITLIDKIKLRLRKTDFKSADDYIAYVLEQVLTELETNEKKEEQQDGVFSKEDQENVEQRLRDLGYL